MFTTPGPDKDYGPNAQKPDLSKETFDLKVAEHMKRLAKTKEEVLELEKKTANQKNCQLWLEERRLRLTASNFGLICNRKPESNCGPVVAQMLYRKVDTPAMKYGQTHEADAVKVFEELTGVTVTKCGLFVDPQRPWLAASPDGLVGEDSVLEVKCPMAGKDLTPEEVIQQKKGLVGSFWQYDKGKKSYAVKKRHSYYHQIQGQLQIKQIKNCYFVLWTPLGMKVEKVEKDDIFWKTTMLPKLEQFYFNCLLPEIIDPRRRRNMPIKEPEYILKAQGKKQQKLSQTGSHTD